MRSPCGPHAVPMRSPCGPLHFIRKFSNKSRCGPHAVPMRSPCGPRCGPRCGPHAVPMRSPCGPHAVPNLIPFFGIGKNRLFLEAYGLSGALDLALDSGLASKLEDLVTKLGVIRIRPCQARPSSDPATEPSSQYGKAIGSYLPSVPN